MLSHPTSPKGTLSRQGSKEKSPRGSPRTSPRHSLSSRHSEELALGSSLGGQLEHTDLINC